MYEFITNEFFAQIHKDVVVECSSTNYVPILTKRKCPDNCQLIYNFKPKKSFFFLKCVLLSVLCFFKINANWLDFIAFKAFMHLYQCGFSV